MKVCVYFWIMSVVCLNSLDIFCSAYSSIHAISAFHFRHGSFHLWKLGLGLIFQKVQFSGFLNTGNIVVITVLMSCFVSFDLFSVDKFFSLCVFSVPLQTWRYWIRCQTFESSVTALSVEYFTFLYIFLNVILQYLGTVGSFHAFFEVHRKARAAFGLELLVRLVSTATL